jgi:hypothetical protein
MTARAARSYLKLLRPPTFATASRTGAVAGGARVVERADSGVQRNWKTLGRIGRIDRSRQRFRQQLWSFHRSDFLGASVVPELDRGVFKCFRIYSRLSAFVLLTISRSFRRSLVFPYFSSHEDVTANGLPTISTVLSIYCVGAACFVSSHTPLVGCGLSACVQDLPSGEFSKAGVLKSKNSLISRDGSWK